MDTLHIISKVFWESLDVYVQNYKCLHPDAKQKTRCLCCLPCAFYIMMGQLCQKNTEALVRGIHALWNHASVSSENWKPYLLSPFWVINVVFFIWKLPNSLWILSGAGYLLWAPSIVLHLKVKLPFSFLFSRFLLSWLFPTLSSDQVSNRYRYYWRENNKEHNINM